MQAGASVWQLIYKRPIALPYHPTIATSISLLKSMT